MEFIIGNLDAILGLTLALVLIIYALFTRSWSMLQLGAYRLMLSAERLMATAEGKQKMEVVFRVIWNRVPKWLKRFVTEKTVKDKLQTWYDIAKNDLLLESNKGLDEDDQ